MDVWLVHHWKTLPGGWGVPLGIWLWRGLRPRRLSLKGDTWTFKYRRPEDRPLPQKTRKSKSRR